MPNGAVDALKEELTQHIGKRYDDVEMIVKPPATIVFQLDILQIKIELKLSFRKL